MFCLYPQITRLGYAVDCLSKLDLNFFAMNPPASPKIGIETMYNAK